MSNYNIYEEETKKLETLGQCKRILNALPEGIENAISLKELSKRIVADERTTRGLILEARLNGYMICSLVPETTGYFRPSNTWEALTCYQIFKKRELTSVRVAQTMKEWFLKRGIDPDKPETFKNKEEGESNAQ